MTGENDGKKVLGSIMLTVYIYSTQLLHFATYSLTLWMNISGGL